MESKFTSMMRPPSEWIGELDKVGNYKRFCASKLADCDKALTDIDHLLELTRLDGVKMVRVTAKRKEILQERRFYKDESDRCDLILQAMPQVQNFYDQLKTAYSKLKDFESRIENRAYTPRVLFDIFDYDPQTLLEKQQRRQDITKLGKRASKKALSLEEKFRQIEGDK